MEKIRIIILYGPYFMATYINYKYMVNNGIKFGSKFMVFTRDNYSSFDEW